MRERAREPELEYIFKHALAQEATYESILLQRRKELHRRVAAAIEILFADRLDEFLGLLAYHYTKAEDWEKAQEYLFKAADQAGSIAADAEALVNYEQAIAAHARVFGDSWDPTEQAVLERKIGEALYRLGRFDEARVHLVRAMTLLGCPLPESRGALRRALAKELVVQVGHRLVAAVLGRVPVAPASADLDERLRAFDPLNNIEITRDPVAQLHLTLLMLNRAERAGFARGVASATVVLSFGLDVVAMPRLAGLYLHSGMNIVGEDTAPELLRNVAGSQAGHELMIGEWADAKRHFLEAARFSLEIGDLYGWGLQTALATLHMVEEGDFLLALRLGEAVIEQARESGDQVTWPWGTVPSVMCCSDRGRWLRRRNTSPPAIPCLSRPGDGGTRCCPGAFWRIVCCARGGSPIPCGYLRSAGTTSADTA